MVESPKPAKSKAYVRSMAIVVTAAVEVKPEAGGPPQERKRGRPGRLKTRRQSHGSAWHWKQTDAW